MAIIKTHLTPQGVTANYHRLSRLELNAEGQFIMMTFNIYYSEEAYNAGAQPVWHNYVRIPLDKFIVDPRQTFYTWASQYMDSYLGNGVPSFSEPLDLENSVKLKPEYVLP